MPVAGEIESDTSVVVAQLGYRALVYARPEDQKLDIQGERKGNVLTVTNVGNTNVFLEGQEQCSVSGTDCEKTYETTLARSEMARGTLAHNACKIHIQ